MLLSQIQVSCGVFVYVYEILGLMFRIVGKRRKKIFKNVQVVGEISWKRLYFYNFKFDFLKNKIMKRMKLW